MICHVTTVTCLFIIKEKNINIKSRKIDKRKRKILVSKYIITNVGIVSGAVHTGVEVCRMDSEMSELVE